MSESKLKPRESFGELFPDLCAYWNYEKNGDLQPSYVSARSRRKVW